MRKHTMWMISALFAAASAAGAAPAAAKPAGLDRPGEETVAAKPAPAPAAAATTAKRALKKKIGVGLDYIPGASQSLPFVGVANTPNALGVRWWATDRLGIDLRVAADVNSVTQGTSGTSNTTNGWGLGLGAKLNLTQPSDDLLGQLVARVSYGGSTQSNSTPGSARSTISQLALFLGVGFEAFVPGWDWISLEGSAGLGLSSQQVVPDSSTAQVSQSSSRFYLGGEGFTPLNLAMHFYF